VLKDSDIQRQYTGTAVFIFFHIAALLIGFSILTAVYEFPAVLHESSQYKLNLYLANQSIVQPVFWLLAIAGFTQIALSVFLYRSLRNHSKIMQKNALLFGVLAGMLQTFGFIHGAALPPWLGVYAPGLCLGLWTTLTGAAMFVEQRLFDRKIGAFGVGVGCVALLLALEQFGAAPATFGLLVDYGFPAWAVWLVVVAVSLLKTDPSDREGPLFGWKSFSWSACLYVLMILSRLLV
jgi:hypothetical protein